MKINKNDGSGYARILSEYNNGGYDINETQDYYELVPRDTELILADLRKIREECFEIINRGQAWYNTLTESQKNELQQWYLAWLDVTETGIAPTKPTWLDRKQETESQEEAMQVCPCCANKFLFKRHEWKTSK